MYSLSSKKDNAHEDCIWTCDWGRITTQPNIDEDGGDPDTDHAGGPVPYNRWVLSGPEYAQ